MRELKQTLKQISSRIRQSTSFRQYEENAIEIHDIPGTPHLNMRPSFTPQIQQTAHVLTILNGQEATNLESLFLLCSTASFPDMSFRSSRKCDQAF